MLADVEHSEGRNQSLGRNLIDSPQFTIQKRRSLYLGKQRACPCLAEVCGHIRWRILIVNSVGEINHCVMSSFFGGSPVLRKQKYSEREDVSDYKGLYLHLLQRTFLALISVQPET
jgi:hypothetical protein